MPFQMLKYVGPEGGHLKSNLTSSGVNSVVTQVSTIQHFIFHFFNNNPTPMYRSARFFLGKMAQICKIVIKYTKWS
jgi:5-bromo-4-chloroindolyl phosphate hydrolysis protein